MSTKIKTLDFTNQIFYVGIDVHKSNWKITVRSNGNVFKKMSVDPSPAILKRSLDNVFPGASFHSVYEAGFSGFWAHRELDSLGIRNIVVNAADVPTSNKEKDRKSDPVDSNKLSRELDNGSLTGIFVPSEEQEGLRSLGRLLGQYRKRSTQVKNRIKGFLHFVGVKIPSNNDNSHWSNSFITFLKDIKFSTSYNREVLDFHIHELEIVRKQQLKILKRIRHISKENEVLKLLRSIPGIGLITAFTLYTELFDINRFSNFDKLASFVGLVPSLSSSDKKVIVKGLTHRHAKHLRYMLVEASWSAIRKDPAMTKAFLDYCKRMEKQEAIIRIAKKLLSRIRYVWRTKKEYDVGIVQ